MIFLRGNTASQEVLFGPFVDSTDGNTAETALTIANTDIKLWKSGATTLASKNSGGATHISNGNYYAVLDATDTATYGPMEIVVQVAGALAVRREYIVLPEIVYDSFVPASSGAPLPLWGVLDWGVPQTSAAGTLVARSGLSLADDIPNGSVANIYSGTGAGQSRVVDDFTGSSDTFSVSPNWTTTPTTGSFYAIFASPPSSTATVPDVNVTKAAGTAWNSGAITASTLATDTITAAKVAADVTTELQTGLATASALSTVAGYIDTEVAAIKTKTDFLPSATAGAAGGLFIAGSNAATTVNITGSLSGSVGSVTGNVGGNVGGSVGSVVGAVGSVTGNVGGNVNGSVASVTAVNDKTGYSLSAAGIDAIWDEPKAGHVTAGTYGVYLDSAVSGVSTGGLSVSDIVDGILDEPVAAHIVTGSVGATLSETNTEVGQVKSKTDNLTFTKAGEVDANMQSVNGATITGTTKPFDAS
jgi:hypothetical protein